MKKRYISVMLVIFCVLMFIGCGTKEEGQVTVEEAPVLNEEAEPAEEQVRQEEEPEQIIPEKTEVREPAEFIEGSAPVIRIGKENKVWYTEDGQTTLLEVSAPVLMVENEGFEELQNIFLQDWNGIKEEKIEFYRQLLQKAKEEYAECTDEEKEYFWRNKSSEWMELTRSDSSVVSVIYHWGGDAIDGEYSYGYKGVTYDTKTGKELSLADVIENEDDFNSQIEFYETGKKLDEIDGWYMNAAGIVIIYDCYELEVTIPYGNYMKKEYRNPHRELIAQVSIGEDISWLLGEEECIRLEKVEDFNLQLVTENAREYVGGFEYILRGYVIRRQDERSFLLITCDYMSDDYVTFVYELTGGQIHKCDGISGLSIPTGNCISTEQIEMDMAINMLGTYWPGMTYILEEDGKLTQTEEIFWIDSDHPITVIKELPVVIEGTETTLAIGEQILVTGTDNVDTVYFKTVDGEKSGTIQYEIDEEKTWIRLIDGLDEYEYFEYIPYVG